MTRIIDRILGRIINWLLDLFCEPESSELHDVLRFLADWRHPTYRLAFIFTQGPMRLAIYLSDRRGNWSECHLHDVQSVESVRAILVSMAGHLDAKAKEATMPARGVARIYDLPTVGRDI